jgi:cell division protein ZapE
MYGGVGRGKSFLMDCFFNAVPIKRKARLHFHEFMREVHRELADLQGTVNPLDELGARMAKRYKLICFDEFHVADITDAMILHRLLAALFDNGVGFVTTSNFKPDDLYPNGLHRDRILPAIELLNQRAGSDQCGQRHRLPAPHHGAGQALPHAPGPRGRCADGASLHRLAEAHDEDPVLHIEAREIRARRKAGGVVWFDFKHPVRRPALAERLPGDRDAVPHRAAVDVPYMPVRMASEARRFTWLVDVLYDRRVKLIMSAAVPPEAAVHRRPWPTSFRAPCRA